MRRTMWIAIALFSLGSVSACSAPPPYAIFEEPQTDVDRVSVDGLGPEGAVLNADSTRNLGSHDGNTFYVAKVAQDEGDPIEPVVCLIAFSDEASDVSASGCATNPSSDMQMQTPTANVILIPDDYDRTSLPGGDWVELHRNLLSR
ncbi:hypothetical protein GCM10009582_19580 [Arthrobacter flavus]